MNMHPYHLPYRVELDHIIHSYLWLFPTTTVKVEHLMQYIIWFLIHSIKYFASVSQISSRSISSIKKKKDSNWANIDERRIYDHSKKKEKKLI